MNITCVQYISSCISKNSPSLFAGVLASIVLLSFSTNSSADTSNDQSAQSGRSAAFQKRVQAEQAAEDQRERDYKLEEQAMQEELELKKIRAERAAQRNAAAAAAKQQQQQPPAQ